MLYYSLVYPYKQYCILVWGSTYPSNLNRIVLLQKRLIRIVYKASYDAHTKPFFKELGILPFDKIYHLGKFMYQFHAQSIVASQFWIFSPKYESGAQLYTRNSKLYFLPFCRTNIRQFSISNQGVKYLNSLPQDICEASSVFSFREKLKYIFLISF
jgi:hypothetical protein